MEITFDLLPHAVAHLSSEISEIKKLLLAKSKDQPTDTDLWFDLTELCNYLPDKPAKPTVYGWVHNNLIPCHKGGKKLRFFKPEIDIWLKQGKKRTVSEIEAETDAFISSLKRKGGAK